MHTYDYSTSPIKDIKTIFIILFLFPTFWGYLDIGKGQLLFLCSTFILILTIIISHHYKIKFPFIALGIFGTISLYYLLSLNINLSFSKFNTISQKDYTDVLRPIFYMFYFSIPSFLNFTGYNLKYLIRIFVILTMIILVFDIIKFIPQFIPFLKLYTLFEPNSLNYNRFYGTFCFCYNYGFIMLFCLALCLYDKSKYKCIKVIGYILIFILIGSRSVIIACIMSFVIYYISSPIALYKKITFVPFIIGICVLLFQIIVLIEIPIITDSIDYTTRLIESISGTAQDGSFNTRSSQLEKAMILFYQSPIIGNGPIKGNTTPIEIQFGYYLSAWGIIGTFLFLSIMAIFFIWAHQSSKSKNVIVANFSKANRLWLIVSFFVGMSTPITDQIRVFQIFYLLQGIQYAIYHNSTKLRSAR